MAWEITQGTGVTPTQVLMADGGSATATKTITPSTTGSTLFALIAIGQTEPTSKTWTVSDNVDGAWTVLMSQSDPQDNGTTSIIAYRDNASSTAQRTVTITRNRTTYADYLTWSLAEATHAGVTFETDGYVTGGNGGTTGSLATIATSSLAPTTAADLIIGVGSIYGGSAWTHPVGTDSGWANLQSCWSLTGSGAGTDGIAVIQVSSSSSPFTTTFTETSGSCRPTGIVAAFKGAAGGGAQDLMGTATGGATAAGDLSVTSSETFLYPDAILASSHLAGAVTDIDDPHGSPDGAWLTVQ